MVFVDSIYVRYTCTYCLTSTIESIVRNFIIIVKDVQFVVQIKEIKSIENFYGLNISFCKKITKEG